MTIGELRSKLLKAVDLDFPYSKRPIAEKKGADASVLIALGIAGQEPFLLMTRRTEKVENHKGEMAFPGGRRDQTDTSESHTALREMQEELGVSASHIEILGALPKLPTFTGFNVTPVVGLISVEPAEIDLHLNHDEIEEAFWISFEELLSPGVYREEAIPIGKVKYPISVFQVRNYRIWGATAVIIKNLLDRLATLS